MKPKFSFEEAYREYGTYAHELLKKHPTQSLTSVVYAFWEYDVLFYVPPAQSFNSVGRWAEQGPLKRPPPELAELTKAIPEELK